jgi:hypothetical protein
MATTVVRAATSASRWSSAVGATAKGLAVTDIDAEPPWDDSDNVSPERQWGVVLGTSSNSSFTKNRGIGTILNDD